MPPALEMHALAKRYHAGILGCSATVDALRDVELAVARGEVVEVVGRRGSGKSTLLLCAAGILRPDAGRVVWFGAARREIAPLPAVAYVAPGEPPWRASAAVGESLARAAARCGVVGREARRAVHDALYWTRLEAQASARIADLTSGARRRLALARALLVRPRLLLADDLLTGLDDAECGVAADCLRTIGSGGVAVVVASAAPAAHDRVGARAVVLEEGRLRTPLPATRRSGARVRVAERVSLGPPDARACSVDPLPPPA